MLYNTGIKYISYLKNENNYKIPSACSQEKSQTDILQDPEAHIIQMQRQLTFSKLED